MEINRYFVEKEELLMNVQSARKTLHELIDRTKDEELLTLCVQLLEREMRKSSKQEALFDTSSSDLISRTEASMESIAAGRTRNIQEFKKEIDLWKQGKPM